MESLLRKTSGLSKRSKNRVNSSSFGVKKTNVTVEIRGLSRKVARLNHLEIIKDLESYNPTLKSVLKVEELFQKHGEFDSRTQLMREMDGSMKIQVLNVILKYLKSLGKVLDNNDGSWTWVFSKNNEKLKSSWDKAGQL